MQPVFRILGPLEVKLSERAVALGRRERALLGVLLLNTGEAVSVERLIDGVWGDAPPSSAKHMVHEYVSRLRTALGDASRIATRAPGYVVVCGGEELDASLFSQLAVAARAAAGAGDHVQALPLYEQALSLWRGDALEDVQLEGDAQIDVARLDQLRQLVSEERIDSALALGRHRELIPELERHVRDEPLAERPRAQLMLALYRSGRQTDALERFRDGRALLVEHSGVEPGPELRRLERAILQHDAALELAPETATADDAAAPDDRPAAAPPRSGRRPILALAGVAALALIAGAVWFGSTRGSSSAPHVALVQGDGVAVVDAASARLVGSISVGSDPGPITAGAGSLWVSNLRDDSLSRISPDSYQVRSIQLGMQATGLASVGGSIFAVGARPLDAFVTVKRINSTFDQATRLATVPSVIAGDPGFLTASRSGRLLVAPASGLMTWIDPASGHPHTLTDPSATSVAVAQGFGSSWLVEPDANAVVRVSESGLRTTIQAGRSPSAIAIGATAVWVANRLADTVVAIDPQTNTLEHIVDVGGAPSGIAVAGDAVWVANSGTGSLTRIDARTGRVTGSVRVGGSPQALIVADGKVWVTVQRRTLPPATATGGTLIVNRPAPVDPLSLDPALTALPDASLIEYSTCLDLINYPDAQGAAGTRLVPDAATSLPTLSHDRRTLTFVIRGGQRFSPPSNQVVTAATFKSSIERNLNPRLAPKGKAPYALGSLADIVGARAFATGKRGHVSGIEAHGNTLTIRLMHPEPSLLGRLASVAGCALPTDTPVLPLTGLIPSAGPYFIASQSPSEGVVLARNPNYHGSRPHALRRIVIRYGMSKGQSISQVEAGRADYSLLGVPAADGARLRKAYGAGSPAARAGHQRYFESPRLAVAYIALNTARPLFSRPNVRLAVNYAVDRAALARAGVDPFNPGSVSESDAYLPPGMPAYRGLPTYSPKPDLARARSLMGDSHRRTAILYACNLPPCQQLAQILKRNLAPVGIDVEPRYLPLGSIFEKIFSNPDEPYDMALVGWIADSIDPGDFLEALLGGEGANLAHYKSRALTRSFAAADGLSGTRRLLAYANLDATLVRDAAPLVAFGNSINRDLFSARIGCVTYQPVYGMDLGALCIRKAPS